MAAPSMTADLPALTTEFETSVPNLFIAGELGGLALIKNAVNQVATRSITSKAESLSCAGAPRWGNRSTSP
ncbi:MAG: hypothetical protein R2882_09330 [Gemmatimonadales bacterium]